MVFEMYWFWRGFTFKIGIFFIVLKTFLMKYGNSHVSRVSLLFRSFLWTFVMVKLKYRPRTSGSLPYVFGANQVGILITEGGDRISCIFAFNGRVKWNCRVWCSQCWCKGLAWCPWARPAQGMDVGQLRLHVAVLAAIHVWWWFSRLVLERCTCLFSFCLKV